MSEEKKWAKAKKRTSNASEDFSHQLELERRHSLRVTRNNAAFNAPVNPVHERSRAARQSDVEEVVVLRRCKASNNVWMIVAQRKKVLFSLPKVHELPKHLFHSDVAPLEPAFKHKCTRAAHSKRLSVFENFDHSADNERF